MNKSTVDENLEPTNVTPSGKNGSSDNEGARKMSPKAWLFIIFLGLIAIGVGGKIWWDGRGFVSTDDAYLTADVVQVAPQVTGVVKQLLVTDNQVVKAGQLLVVLDDAPFKETVAQRQADLDAAIAQAKGAGVSVDLVTASGQADEVQAQSGVAQSQAGYENAEAEITRSNSGIRTAKANAKSIQAGISASQAALDYAIVNKQRAVESINSAQAQLDAAQAAVRTADAGVNSARANADKADKNKDRYAELFARGASSKQTYEDANATSIAADSELESARERVNSAKSVVTQKQAELNSVKEQLASADAQIAQCRAQLEAVKQQYSASLEGIQAAQVQRLVATKNVKLASAKQGEAVGKLSKAQTLPEQVRVSKSSQDQALARVEQTKAALDAANLQLGYTRIYASMAGRISKRSVAVGSLVSQGTPMMALVQAGVPWVVANFKETQLKGISNGCEAHVHVDSFPGEVFEGHVDSLSPATGSTFALLPADNATGNFTKIVQRMPVKIILDPNQQDADKLSAGMSVVAKVKVN